MSDFQWVCDAGGPVVTWVDGHHRLEGDGLEGWFSSVSMNSLSKHTETALGLLMFELRPAASGAGVMWESTLRVADGRYVRARDTSSDFPSALAAVETYRHEHRVIGALTWWRESESRWVSWLGERRLEADRLRSLACSDDAGCGADECWVFRASGDAKSLEEAALLASMTA